MRSYWSCLAPQLAQKRSVDGMRTPHVVQNLVLVAAATRARVGLPATGSELGPLVGRRFLRLITKYAITATRMKGNTSISRPMAVAIGETYVGIVDVLLSETVLVTSICAVTFSN